MPPTSLDTTIKDIESALDGLKDAAAAYQGGRTVPPLGALAPSPLIAAQAGPPGPATTTPFLQAHAAARAEAAAPTHLKAFWHKPGVEGAPPVERLSSDGTKRLAYEVSHKLDACGGPVWERTVLPLSPEAELCLSEHVGAARVTPELLAALRTIAKGEVTIEYAAALAANMLERFKATEGPTFVVPPSARPAPARPMPEDAAPVVGELVVVNRDGCALVVVKCDHLLKFGDEVVQTDASGGGATFHGEVIRVTPKDNGAFDLIIAAKRGALTPGQLVFRRPAVAAPPVSTDPSASSAPAAAAAPTATQ